MDSRRASALGEEKPMIRTRLIALTAALISPFILGGFAAAHSATPAGATPAAAAACTVTPRTDAELAALGATPAAAATPQGTETLPAGDPVDKATFAAIQQTLDQVRACEQSGNVNAVLALYTDAYVSNVALAPETVPIVAGTPNPAGSGPNATPIADSNLPLTLIEANLQTDGSVAGLVLYGSTPHIFVFVEQAGLWRIDRTALYAQSASNGAPAGPVQNAIAAAAAKLGAATDSLKLIYASQRDWPDSSLGCPEPGKFYAQVITPGWIVLIGGSGEVLEYHTDANQNVVLCRTMTSR
jgi:hypothetical protein